MEAHQYPKGTKTVSQSRTEVTRTVFYQDLNGFNRLFGGRLMEWIDEAAGIAARRHCGSTITTACVDQLEFKHAVHLDDDVVIIAKVTYVGRTSLEVRVDSYVEEYDTRERNLINTAFLTEVCIDENGKATPIEYGLELEGDDERTEWESATKRLIFRKTRKAEGF